MVSGTLKSVAEAELEPTLRGIGVAFAKNLAKGTAGRAYIRIVEVWMVDVVESLGLEDTHGILGAGDDAELLLRGSRVAWEAWALVRAPLTAGSAGTGSD